MNWKHFETLESYLPVDLSLWENSVAAFFVILFFIGFRYFLLSGGAYLYFWKWRSFHVSRKILHDKKLPSGQIRGEIFWSLMSCVLFAFSGLLIGLLWQQGYSQIYLQFSEYGLWYLFVSFILYSVVHEIYFYWTHVWMHQPGIYRRVHAIHHQSVKPSPWASFSFHPFEATVHALFLPLLVLVIPIHPVVLIVYLTFMTLTAISNHLGVEVFKDSWLKKYFISGEHHFQHHQKMKFNYGLYYTFLDHVMGTEYSRKTKKVRVKTSEKIYE